MENDSKPINWKAFKTTFYENYFPASIRNAKELEFMQLRHGGKSIAEYTTKFEELCKFSTIYQDNPNEHWKCMKYEGGLRAEILASVDPLEIRNYVACNTLINPYYA